MPYVRNTWVDYPATTTAITAARLNNIELGILAVETSVNTSVFTTEAARDAAITSPFEGQRAYITASTIASATGTNPAIPTGIQTIYNGAAWVCVTPMGGWSATNATTASVNPTFASTLGGDATPISATLSTGTSVRLGLSANFIIPIAAGAGNVFVTYAVSGATTVLPQNTASIVTTATGNNYFTSCAREVIITGLTAGTNVFTMNFAVSTNTVTFVHRALVAAGIA